MIKNIFPFFKKTKNIYLDSAATTQKPKEVIDSYIEYVEMMNSNSGRSSYDLAYNSSKIMEETRKDILRYFNLDLSEYDVIFTKNATESINLIGYTYGLTLNENDEIILSTNNHHSNILIWQYLEKFRNIKVIYIDIDDNGEIDLDKLKNSITEKTKLISISHIVNTTGVENNIEEILKIIKGRDIKVNLDISQSVAHLKLDLSLIECDFYEFSAHKMYGMQGLGILIGKKKILNEIPPFLYGGDMVDYVDYKESIFKESPYKFEGGTQNIAAIYSFKKTLEFLNNNFDEIKEKENEIYKYLLENIKKKSYIIVYNLQYKIPILAFNVENVHPHDVSSILNFEKISIRTGKHCTELLLKQLGIHSCCRISISCYNTKEDIDKLLECLDNVYKMFN